MPRRFAWALCSCDSHQSDFHGLSDRAASTGGNGFRAPEQYARGTSIAICPGVNKLFLHSWLWRGLWLEHAARAACAGISVGVGCAVVTAYLGVSLAVIGPAHAEPAKAPRVSAPPQHEPFAVFESLAKRYRGDKYAAPVTPLTHPLARWVVAALTPSWLPGDTVAIINVADSTLPLTWRISPDRPEKSATWLRDAEQVATGYYVLGMQSRALEWLHAIERTGVGGSELARVRHLLTHYYVTHGDTTAVQMMARTLTPKIVSTSDGVESAWAVVAGLYVLGRDDDVVATVARVAPLRPCSDLFRALNWAQNNDAAVARGAVARFLMVASRHGVSIPPRLVQTALLTAADLDWKIGLDGVARREYLVLAHSKQPYVSVWSQFMLGAVAMYGNEYADARKRFGALCGSHRAGMWKQVGCALEHHADFMRNGGDQGVSK